MKKKKKRSHANSVTRWLSIWIYFSFCFSCLSSCSRFVVLASLNPKRRNQREKKILWCYLVWCAKWLKSVKKKSDESLWQKWTWSFVCDHVWRFKIMNTKKRTESSLNLKAISPFWFLFLLSFRIGKTILDDYSEIKT